MGSLPSQNEQVQPIGKDLEKRPSFLIYFLIKLPISLIAALCAPGPGTIVLLFISPLDPVGGGETLYTSLGIYPLLWWGVTGLLAVIQIIPSFLFVFLYFIKSHFHLRMGFLKVLLGIWVSLLIAEVLTFSVGWFEVTSKYNKLISQHRSFIVSGQ